MKEIKDDKTNWFGFNIDIVKELGERLNFRQMFLSLFECIFLSTSMKKNVLDYSIIYICICSYVFVEADQYGAPLKDGTGMWSGQIGMLIRDVILNTTQAPDY